MSAQDFDRLAPHLTRLPLARGAVLTEPERPIEYAYFLESGIGSSVAISPEGHTVEVGLFGRDGVAPIDPVMGSDRTLNRVFLQIAGDVWRIERSTLVDAMEASSPLRGLLIRYAHAISIQTSFTALSNAVHAVEERLARWLLMCDDRIDGGELALTHEFLSVMLAVRRPSVTTALHVLEGSGLIRAKRGCVTVRDRAGLEDFAGDAYGKAEAEYHRLIGPLRPSPGASS